MATIKPISSLPSGTSTAPTDLAPMTQGSTGPGTGTTAKITLATAVQGATGIVNVLAFGAVGDGVTNDSAAFAAAAAALPSEGVVLVPAGYAYLLGDGLTVPHGVTLQGASQIGEALPDGTWGVPQPGGRFDYHDRGSVLMLPTTETVVISNRSALRNLYIMAPDVMTGPITKPAAQAIVDAFAGTAVSVAGSDAVVDSVFIMGFDKAIVCDGFERPYFKRVMADCTNGISITDCTDTPRVEDCEIFPFFGTGHNTYLTGDTDLIFRSGTAYDFSNVADGLVISNSISYGYAIGCLLSTVSLVRVVHCLFDNNVANAISGNTIGIKTSGQIVDCLIDNCVILEQLTGLDMNHSGANSVLTIGAISVGVSTAKANMSLMRIRPGAAGQVGQFNGGGAGPDMVCFWVNNPPGAWNFGSIYLANVGLGTNIWNISTSDIPAMTIGSILQDTGSLGTDALGARYPNGAYGTGVGYGNYVNITGAPNGTAPTLTAAGLTDTDIDLRLAPQNSGKVRFGVYTVDGTVTPTGYITIKADDGTVLKVLVKS